MLPTISGSAGSVSVTRTRRAVRGGWETSTPKSTKSRRVVPIDGWLADDLRAYLANDHPHGDPASPDYDANAVLLPGRFGRSEALPEGFWRDDIEPVRNMVLDADAPISAKTGEPDRRYTRPDPHAPATRVAPSSGYKWSVPVNPAGIAKHYLAPPALARSVSSMSGGTICGTRSRS